MKQDTKKKIPAKSSGVVKVPSPMKDHPEHSHKAHKGKKGK